MGRGIGVKSWDWVCEGVRVDVNNRVRCYSFSFPMILRLGNQPRATLRTHSRKPTTFPPGWLPSSKANHP
jgi:hypothetical protein